MNKGNVGETTFMERTIKKLHRNVTTKNLKEDKRNYIMRSEVISTVKLILLKTLNKSGMRWTGHAACTEVKCTLILPREALRVISELHACRGQ
jgi:hypothetical protein